MALGMHPASLYPRRSRVAPIWMSRGGDPSDASLYGPHREGVKRLSALELAGYNAEKPLMTFDDQLKRVFDTAMAELIELSGSERRQVRQQAVEEGRTQGWE